MKRYMVFAGQEYYATGGMNDFIDSFESQNSAVIRGQTVCQEIEEKYGPGTWFHIYDTEEMEIVEFSGKPFGSDKMEYDENETW